MLAEVVGPHWGFCGLVIADKPEWVLLTLRYIFGTRAGINENVISIAERCRFNSKYLLLAIELFF